MININRITESLFYVMLLSPLLSYVTFGLAGLLSIQRYLMVIVIIYGFGILVLKRNSLNVPNYIILAFLWFCYTFIWAFFNGYIESRGILPVLLDKELAIVFVLLIIYNTNFSDQFIRASIFLFKVTVLLTVTFSIWQVFDSSILNAWELWRDDNSINTGDIYSFRRASIYGFIDPNALGLSFIPLLSILIGYTIRNKINNILLFLILGAIVAFVSNTRYIMVAYIIITFQILIAGKDNSIDILKYFFMSLTLIFTSYFGLQYLGYDLNTWYQQRLFSEGDIQDSTRYAAILNFLTFFPDNFLIGNGDIKHPDVVAASNMFNSSHIHIGYLSHLVAYGIIGCSFLFGYWAILAKRLYYTALHTNYWGSFFGFVAFLFAFATMSQSSIFYYGLMYVFVFDKYFSGSYSNLSHNKFE